MSKDPMLDGITRYDSDDYDVELPEKSDGIYVLFSDLPALLAAVREDERGKMLGMNSGFEWAYEQGQRDEREAIDAEITADLTARIQREREDRDPDLLLGGIDYALQNVLRVIRARGES